VLSTLGARKSTHVKGIRDIWPRGRHAYFVCFGLCG
jgi:hypothetical protein